MTLFCVRAAAWDPVSPSQPERVWGWRWHHWLPMAGVDRGTLPTGRPAACPALCWVRGFSLCSWHGRAAVLPATEDSWGGSAGSDPVSLSFLPHFCLCCCLGLHRMVGPVSEVPAVWFVTHVAVFPFLSLIESFCAGKGQVISLLPFQGNS